MGTKLMINGTVYTVEDRGTSYGHVDIFFNSHSEALQFGSGYADVYQVNLINLTVKKAKETAPSRMDL